MWCEVAWHPREGNTYDICVGVVTLVSVECEATEAADSAHRYAGYPGVAIGIVCHVHIVVARRYYLIL